MYVRKHTLVLCKLEKDVWCEMCSYITDYVLDRTQYAYKQYRLNVFRGMQVNKLVCIQAAKVSNII